MKNMSLSSVCLLFVLILASYVHGYIDIEKYLKTCDRNSPDVNDCLLEAIQDGLPKFSEGIADLGVPSIDPYHQNEFRVEYKNNQIVAKMNTMDVVVVGMKDAKVHDVRLRADDDRFHLEIDMSQPRVFVTGRYRGEGRYNSLKVNATGDFNTTMRDLVYTWKLDGLLIKRDNETYMKINSFYMRPDVGDMRSYISGIFPDNPQLSDLANNIANQNWRILYREMLPYAQANWNSIGIRICNKIFLKIPYNQLFPANA